MDRTILEEQRKETRRIMAQTGIEDDRIAQTKKGEEGKKKKKKKDHILWAEKYDSEMAYEVIHR